MSQAEVLGDLVPPAGVVVVAVAQLPAGSSFRADGLCVEQVERLVATGGIWPPILVGRADGVVIDGAHRVEAARRLGLGRLRAELFDGGPEAAFVEFVRRNVAQGLVLGLEERRRAALRVLGSHPQWSDRRVAELCGLSPKTVGRLRGAVRACPAEDDPQSDGGLREGRDRRMRPVRRGSVRARVVEALRAQPDASLRAIAAVAGASPETVRLVRMNLAEAPAPLDADTGQLAVGQVYVGGADEVSPAGEGPVEWRSDAALRSSAQGDGLLAWLEQTAVGEADLAWADAVPLSRAYVVADEARRRSDAWLRLARALEARTSRKGR
ncbi:MAG TPA: ParB/RepB/Spo0J family partition protein [Acidimicrobiales bacterium]|nr:ParB/RepB/Spo0J family partition protein [Acidimicrobiales bacterium]